LKTSYKASITFNGERFRRNFKNLNEAELWEAESKVALLKGEKPVLSVRARPQMQTFRELRNEVFEIRWQGTKAEDSQLNYTKSIMSIFSPSKKIKSINQNSVDLLIKKLRALGNSNATVNRKLTALSVMMNHALDREYVEKIPKIKKLPENNEIVVWFTPEEQDQINTTLINNGKPHIADLIMFLCNTGMRVSEALQLKWKDCEGNKIVVLKSKTNKPRTIPQNKKVIDILSKVSRDTEGPFYGITYAETRHSWDRMRRDLGKQSIEGWTIHGCRHTFCSNLVQKNVPIQVVAQLAGHSDIRTTMRYAHLNTEVLESAVGQLDE
tara:strand:- start:5 stop:979 length:975 start_codon:yes stop_codon:yes gene_type:complete